MVDAPWLLQENHINGQLQALSNISTFTSVSPRLWSCVSITYQTRKELEASSLQWHVEDYQ